MGIKINVVRDIRTLKKITTKDCELGYQGEYNCFSDGCDAHMSFVASHQRRLSDKTITIDSYFKLKKGYEHVYGKCPFNTVGAIDIIARDSSCDELKAIAKGKYEFNLQILHNPNSKTKKFLTSIALDTIKNQTNEPTKKYNKNGVASNYINALTQILKLRAMLEENEDLSSIITLTYQGNTIKWNDFYFEEEQYSRAKNIIKKSLLSYPICVYGSISKLSDKSEQFPYNKIKLNSPYINPKEGINEILSLELNIVDENIKLSDFSVGQEILVYGKVKIDERISKSKTNDKIQFKYINLKIWINYQAQLVLL